jgi:hypothetical protein
LFPWFSPSLVNLIPRWPEKRSHGGATAHPKAAAFLLARFDHRRESRATVPALPLQVMTGA